MARPPTLKFAAPNNAHSNLDSWLNNYQVLKSWLNNTVVNESINDLTNNFVSSDEFSYKFSVQCNLCFLHINIHSLNSKLIEFVEFVKHLGVHFDFIVISEVWSTNVEFFHNLLPGYRLIYDLPQSGRVGGVAMFIDSNLVYSSCNNLRINSSTNSVVESIWVKIKKDKIEYYVGGVYRHPNGDVNEFCRDLETATSSIPTSHPVILTGDFNLNILNYDTNSNVKSYVDLLIMNNFLPVLLIPTRVTTSSATLIDHIFVRDSLINKMPHFQISCGNIIDDLSDHFPNYCFLTRCKSNLVITDRPKIRIFNDKNKKHFSDMVESIDWQLIFNNSDDVNFCYQKFIDVLMSAFERAFPLTQISRRASKNKPWFTASLRKSRSRKMLLYNKWLKSKNPYDYETYINYVKIYKNLLKTASTQYYMQQFDSKINSIKSVWKNLSQFLSSKSKGHVTKIDNLIINGSSIDSPQGIAEGLNNHFCSVGTKITANLPRYPGLVEQFLDPPIMETMFVSPIEAQELHITINSLDCQKAAGDDGLPVLLVKQNSSILLTPLLYIYNLSLNTGIVPDLMKLAKVVPIFKKGELDNPNNYRPISLLSVFDKIFEKLVNQRLLDFLEKHKILYRYQFGFRKNYSTSMALLETIDNCIKNLDNQNIVLALFLDLEKAFDTVCHKTLLMKLYNYGVRGKMYFWLQNYLTNRKQYTKVNDIQSPTSSIALGVPQGSILGPLLFLVYVNDMCNAVRGEFPRLFADDTNLFLVAPDVNTLQTKVNTVCHQLEDWLLANQLSLNVSKTTYLVFKSKKFKNSIPPNFNVSFFGHQVSEVASGKYLGVFIDNDLTWKVHINYIHDKLIKFCGLFYRIRGLVSEECARTLYFSFIHSTLLYGLEVYGNTYISYLDNLMKLNNKILRIILNKPFRTHTVELYKAYDTLPINILHDFLLLKLVHRIFYYKSSVPDVLVNCFSLATNGAHYTLRENLNLTVVRFNTCRGQRSFIYKGSKLWNGLPIDIKKTSNKFIFNNLIRSQLYLEV